jgi:hypothetical protein
MGWATCHPLHKKGGPIPCFSYGLALLLVLSIINEVQALWPTFLQCECEVIAHIAFEQGSLKRTYIFLRLKVQFWHISDRQEGTWRVNTKLNHWS